MQQFDKYSNKLLSDEVINEINKISLAGISNNDNVYIESLIDKNTEHFDEENVKKTLKKYTQYENRKLNNLKEYPPFCKHLDEIRYNICNKENQIEDMDGYEKMLAINDKFYNALANIFKKISSIFPENITNYKMIVYYIIFNRMIPEEYFSCVLPELFYGTSLKSFVKTCEDDLLALIHNRIYFFNRQNKVRSMR